MNKVDFIKAFSEIQRNLKAPKSQYNSFGKYHYRNCEDILNAANKLLGGLVLTLSDDVIAVGDRIYVKVTATITDGENEISNTAMARESLTKKGMDDAMITGATSSYARKYALNGLFCIDDTKDSDHESVSKEQKKPVDKDLEAIKKAVNTNDQEWISTNWNNIIVPKWALLDQQTQNKLQGK